MCVHVFCLILWSVPESVPLEDKRDVTLQDSDVLLDKLAEVLYEEVQERVRIILT